MKPLIIGQAPAAGSNPREPLSGNSGRRLAALCGIPHEAFLDAFERVELLRDLRAGQQEQQRREDQQTAKRLHHPEGSPMRLKIA